MLAEISLSATDKLINEIEREGGERDEKDRRIREKSERERVRL